MAKYLLLYGGGRMPETDDERAQVMKAWEAWFTKLGPAVADPGNPFRPAVKKIAGSGSGGGAEPTASGHSIFPGDSPDLGAKPPPDCPGPQGGASEPALRTLQGVVRGLVGAP